MEILLDYFISNYITIMILLALGVLMTLNRKEKIPASQLFVLGISLLIAITVLDTASEQVKLAGNTSELIFLRTLIEVVKYIIRPTIIMIELFIVIAPGKLKIFYSIPAVINAVIYSATLFGIPIAFAINKNNNWVSGQVPWRYTVYFTQILYVFLLFIHSIRFFRQKNIKKSVVVLLIVLQSVSVALIEYTDIYIIDIVDPITALCILEYYIYLTTIYQQEIKEEIARKELDLIKSDLMVLKNQIQPHFIYNTLNIIRYMIKTDSTAALQCIDSFSRYLKAHIKALRTEDMIPFEQELKNVRDYIGLVQMDYTRKTQTVYELEVTDFLIPPLSLEPIIENAMDHGIGHGNGTVTLKTYAENDNVMIVIRDSGGSEGEPGGYEPVHNGVGLENTRKRIELQCGGTLALNITESGAEVIITLPQKKGQNNEDTGSR